MAGQPQSTRRECRTARVYTQPYRRFLEGVGERYNESCGPRHNDKTPS